MFHMTKVSISERELARENLARPHPNKEKAEEAIPFSSHLSLFFFCTHPFFAPLSIPFGLAGRCWVTPFTYIKSQPIWLKGISCITTIQTHSHHEGTMQ